MIRPPHPFWSTGEYYSTQPVPAAVTMIYFVYGHFVVAFLILFGLVLHNGKCADLILEQIDKSNDFVNRWEEVYDCCVNTLSDIPCDTPVGDGS
ncbi:MAG: hypothetical protein EA379_04130 [Phycisphaerales bacterium]|nr:MAG: hypothetical protein EA379_04130 [Phycisphaerales bacterium]